MAVSFFVINLLMLTIFWRDLILSKCSKGIFCLLIIFLRSESITHLLLLLLLEFLLKGQLPERFIVRRVKSLIFLSLILQSFKRTLTAYVVQIKASKVSAKELCEKYSSRCAFQSNVRKELHGLTKCTVFRSCSDLSSKVQNSRIHWKRLTFLGNTKHFSDRS